MIIKTPKILAGLALLGSLTTSATVAQAAQPIMSVGELTSQPIGHARFCQQYKNECKRTKKVESQVLGQKLWDELVEINVVVNRSLAQMTDMEIYNVEEHWTYPENAGDCEDLVLLKRYMLIQRGWKPSNLLITVVRQPNGEGHALLTARTDRGDFILDNLRDEVLRWDQTEYRYLKRIARDNSAHWVQINDGRSSITGSIN